MPAAILSSTHAATPRWPNRPPPRVPAWAHVAAHVVPWTTVPSGAWRLALGVGIPVGFSGELAELYAAPGWITPYVIALSLLAEGLAYLTLGLVRPWGERVPRWVPRFGGRGIPTLAAVIPAGLGAIAITFINWTSAVNWFGPQNNGHPEAPHGVAGFLMTAAYAPLLLWGPLLGAVTVAYYLRRRRDPWSLIEPTGSTSPSETAREATSATSTASIHPTGGQLIGSLPGHPMTTTQPEIAAAIDSRLLR